MTACILKMKNKKASRTKLPPRTNVVSSNGSKLPPPTNAVSSHVASLDASIPVFPIDTEVFLPSILKHGGLRAVVTSFNEVSRMYGIMFPAIGDRAGTSGSVQQRQVYRYIDKAHLDSYPDGAIPFDSSVRCGTAVSEHVVGIVQGVVVNHVNVPCYYDVGPNSTGTNFFPAHMVASVPDHGLAGNFGDRMAAVGRFALEVIAERAAVAPEVVEIHDESDAPAVSVSSLAAPAAPAKATAPAKHAAAPKAATPAKPATFAPVKAATPAKPATPAAPALPASRPVPPAPQLQLPPRRKSSTDADPTGSSSSDMSDGSDGSGSGSASSGHVTRAPSTFGTATQRTPAKRASRPAAGQVPAPIAGSDSVSATRKRAQKFGYEHDESETLTMFMQLATNVPWLHSRKGQKAIWKFHLDALQNKGHALELVGHRDAVKTFSAWAAHICKTRRTSRLAEARKSGVATIAFDCVDDVCERWEVKVCGEAALTSNNQERALIIRDVMTSTAVGLQEKALNIQQNRAKRYGTTQKRADDDTSVTPLSKTHKASTSPADSPTDPKVLLLRSLAEVTQGTLDQEKKDQSFIAQIVSRFTEAQPQNRAAATSEPVLVSAIASEVSLLESFLTEEDSSLVAWAPRIHAALGITEAAHFKELSVSDVITACQGCIPRLQLNRLLAVAKRQGLGE